jgi:signal transduction histidine kinase
VAKRCPARPKKSDIFGLEITRKANQSPVDVGVIGMTGLLLEGELNPQELKYAETIRVCADALLTIINDILDYSKTESAKLELDLFDFDLIQMVEGTLELLGEHAKTKGLGLAGEIEPDMPSRLHGDAGRLRQILTNVIGNALKFTEKGAVAVRVSKGGLDSLT